MWTTKQIVIAVVMVVTGSINTLSTKWADQTEAPGRADQYGERQPHEFNHPFLQSVGMFIGESSCLLAFHILVLISKFKQTDIIDMGNQGFNPLIFLPAAMCDMTATSLMYIGLNMTFASSFQMLRGAVMIFTAFLSVAFLGRIIRTYMWLGMVIVLLGLVTVGLSDFLFSGENTQDINGIISGDLIIVAAQIVVATQMVYEEKFINKHKVPALQAVGWEGVFGFTVLGLLLIPFNYIYVGKFSKNPQNTLEDPIDGLLQIANSPIIATATAGNILSIAFFNFAGISVTKELSATTRMVLDSLRTVVIWAVSLAVQWQQFAYLQVIGFVLLLIGMCIYNNIIIAPFLRTHNCLEAAPPEELEDPTVVRDERRPLLQPHNTDYQSTNKKG